MGNKRDLCSQIIEIMVEKMRFIKKKTHDQAKNSIKNLTLTCCVH